MHILIPMCALEQSGKAWQVSMNALEEVFKEFGFLRVHVSYIVNSKYIVAWYKDEVELINKVLIPVSRGKKRKISMK